MISGMWVQAAKRSAEPVPSHLPTACVLHSRSGAGSRAALPLSPRPSSTDGHLSDEAGASRCKGLVTPWRLSRRLSGLIIHGPVAIHYETGRYGAFAGPAARPLRDSR